MITQLFDGSKSVTPFEEKGSFPAIGLIKTVAASGARAGSEIVEEGKEWRK